MDLVIPLWKISRWKNTEIKYAIRSIFKHSTEGVGKIFIIGAKPEFFDYSDRLIHIPFFENRAKEVNIWEKVLTACKDERVSDEFFFSNDDYFFLQDFEMSSFPHFHKGSIREFDWIQKPLHQIKDSYRKKTYLTMLALEKHGYETWHFDIHTPNRVEKKKFIDAYNCFQRDIYRNTGLLISTTYGNYNRLTPTYCKDIKIKRKGLESFINNYTEHLLFSTNDDVQGPEFLDFLNTIYPDKSPVEK